MIKKLRLRFAAICILLTGIVVVSLMLIVLGLAITQIKNSSEALFLNTITSIVNKFAAKEKIQDSWLAQLESNGYIISITDRGQPFFFPGTWNPPTDRTALINAAREKSKTEYGLDVQTKPLYESQVSQADFTLRGSHNDQYRVRMIMIPIDQGWYGITVLQDLSIQQDSINRTILFYTLVMLAAIAALSGISWFLAGRAIEPARDSILRQNAFIAAASHELRNPLMVIKSGLSIAKTASDEKKAHYFSIMESEINRLSRLTDDLLLLANNDAQNWDLQLSRVDLEALLLELTEKMLPIASGQGHPLDIALPEELLPQVVADRDRILQILAILVTNAIDHTPKDTRITISAAFQKNRVCLQVIDNGLGIPADDQKKVFDRFYRADKSRSDKRHFGLGLSMAKDLALQHGGTLELSNTPGGGCTFSLKLPLEAVYKHPLNKQR